MLTKMKLSMIKRKSGTSNARRPQLLALLVFASCAFAPIAAAADNWPSWRGPSSSGSRADGKFPVEWQVGDAAWKVALPGKGGSSPIVWGDRIFVSAPDAGENSVLAYDLDGNRLWQTKLGKEKPAKHTKLGSSCNSSPVSDGEAVFVYFKSGHFAALEMDGSVRWQQNLTDEYGPEKLYWDQGSSPVLVGDLVILSRLHGGKSWVAGFDKGRKTPLASAPRLQSSC